METHSVQYAVLLPFVWFAAVTHHEEGKGGPVSYWLGYPVLEIYG